MLDILLLGLNHKTAPVELRESLAFSLEESACAMETIHMLPFLSEVLFLSTCNRVEFLVTTENTTRTEQSIKTFISEFKNIPVKQFEEVFYFYHGDEAVRHVFRVAASLDSMIVGEPQILGQIKAAYSLACQKKTCGVILNKLLHSTFTIAKQIRNQTGIGGSAVSISYAAIELGKKIFGSLEEKKALLIGAGEMAELAVEHLMRNKVGNIFVANRTFERGVELAQRFQGKGILFEEIEDSLSYVDIIISSTSSSGYVISRNQVKGMMRKRRNRPVFFIDIAVPRDIDPAINSLDNAYVYDIDDLKGIIEENIEERKKEAVKGERMVDEAVIRFRKWHESLEVVPTIVALRKKIDTIARVEVEKTLKSLDHLSKNDTQLIRRMTDAIINKILHYPTVFLKNNKSGKDTSESLDITRKLFKIDDE